MANNILFSKSKQNKSFSKGSRDTTTTGSRGGCGNGRLALVSIALLVSTCFNFTLLMRDADSALKLSRAVDDIGHEPPRILSSSRVQILPELTREEKDAAGSSLLVNRIERRYGAVASQRQIQFRQEQQYLEFCVSTGVQ
jgi:hypothetical protein